MSRRFREIVELCPDEFRKHLSFAFSFHYVELKNRNLIDTFIDNVKYVRDNGCSFVIQLNLSDEYIPLCNEIKEICLKEFGALPQIALTRRELKNGYEIMTSYPNDEYISIARSFKSPLFDFTLKNCNYSVPIANEKGLPQTAARTAEKEFKPCLRAVPM